MQGRLWCVCLVLAASPGSLALPTDGASAAALSKHEEVLLEGKSQPVPSHELQKEHRKDKEPPLQEVLDKVLSSKTASAADRVASSLVKLAGGVVEDLGSLVVETIDQLPRTITLVSDAVGKAVDSKREKVLISMRGVKVNDDVRDTSDRIAQAVQNSEFQTSLTAIEDAFADFLGKFIGVTYKNADGISDAISGAVKRLTYPRLSNETHQFEKGADDLEILSRSLKEDLKKDNEITHKNT